MVTDEVEASQALSLKDSFHIGDEIGRGGQAIVRKVQRKSDGKFFACKSIRVTNYREDEVEDEDEEEDPIPLDELQHEAEAEIMALTQLSELKTRGVPELLMVFREKDYYHLVIELCGCSLWEFVRRREKLSEEDAAVVIKRVAEVVEEIQDKGVAHRDLKVTNVLLGQVGEGDDPLSNLKVVDFGSSWTSGNPDEEEMTAVVGTFLAPEMLLAGDQVYDGRVDLWGIGLLLYEILSGKEAFGDMKLADVERKLAALEDVAVTSLDWSSISIEATDFAHQILHLDPDKRLTLQQIQEHPWVVKNCKRREELVEQKLASEVSKKRKREDDEVEKVGNERNIVRMQRANGSWQIVH